MKGLRRRRVIPAESSQNKIEVKDLIHRFTIVASIIQYHEALFEQQKQAGVSETEQNSAVMR